MEEFLDILQSKYWELGKAWGTFKYNIVGYNSIDASVLKVKFFTKILEIAKKIIVWGEDLRF